MGWAVWEGSRWVARLRGLAGWLAGMAACCLAGFGWPGGWVTGRLAHYFNLLVRAEDPSCAACAIACVHHVRDYAAWLPPPCRAYLTKTELKSQRAKSDAEQTAAVAAEQQQDVLK